MNQLTELKAEIERHRKALDDRSANRRVQAIISVMDDRFGDLRVKVIDLIEALIKNGEKQ